MSDARCRSGRGPASAPRPGPLHTRRTFLKRGTAALSAAALARSGALAVDKLPKKIRVGVIGGRFGLQFQWHEHPDCIVEAVSDLRPDRCKRLMQTYKCSKSYPSLEKLVLDKNIDAIAVFTDGPLHVQHTVEGMTHGKHVITAVPAAWGTLEQCHLLRDTVEKHGLTYMMAETSCYRQNNISAQQFYREGKFGQVYYSESEYQHAGLESLYMEGGKRTWRYGVAPMHYPTHCSAHLISVTGERLVEVVCHGWGDDNPVLKDNVYKNPFWNESAMFKTNRGHAHRMNIWWRGAHRVTERAEWIGTKMSFYSAHPNGTGPVLVYAGGAKGKDDAGFQHHAGQLVQYKQPQYWGGDALPKPLRHGSGHDGSHTFLTHEFIDALVHERKPAIDVYESLAYTAPGIVAHESALRGGERMKIPSFDRAAKGVKA